MSRPTNKLSAKLTEKNDLKPGLYGDGGGLYLQVSDYKTKAWVFRYMMAGRARKMGLGDFELVSLKDARKKRDAAYGLVVDGIDPIEARKARKAEQAVENAKTLTFKECAEKYIAAHKAGWKSPKHAGQWEATLETYAYPAIGKLPVAAIDVALVLKVIEPIWSTKTETASRVRGRIESILSWAKARGYRQGENPATWRGHLDQLFTQVTGGSGRTSRRVVLCRSAGIHGQAARQGRRQRPSVGIYYPHHSAHRRHHWRNLERGRQGREALDRAGSPRKGQERGKEARSRCPVVQSGPFDPEKSGDR